MGTGSYALCSSLYENSELVKHIRQSACEVTAIIKFKE